MNSADCYKILGLTEGASHKDVKAARGRLMLQWHPDTVAHNPEFQAIAEEKSKQINIAVDFLMSQPDPASDYARQRDQERAAEQERVERERRKAEDKQRQEEAQRQQQQDAEETRQRRQDAEDQRWQEEQWQREPIDLGEEWQARWKVEAAQKAEQAKQREAAKKAKAVRSRLWGAAFWIVVIINWYVTHPSHQTPTPIPQQVYDAPREAMPAEATPVTPVQQVYNQPKWIAVRNDWLKSDYGRSILSSCAYVIQDLPMG